MNKEQTNRFRIISVQGERSLLLSSERTENSAAVTILVGENGVGKSRLLGDIARSFLVALNDRPTIKENTATDKRTTKLPCDINYRMHGDDITLSPEISRFNMPRAVVAASMSAFHKFPSSERFSRYEDSRNTDLKDFYHLIGTGQGNLGRTPLSTALYGLVESFSKPNNEFNKISHVLDFLKYKRKIAIEFRRRLSRKSLDSLLSGDNDFFRRYSSRIGGANSFSEHRLATFLATSDAVEIEKFISMIKRFLDYFPSGRILIELDLENPDNESLEKFRLISELARFGMATPSDLLMFRTNEKAIRLAEASSGELVITTLILGVANAIQDNSLILIDEPEISLHPAWQQTFLRLLLQAFSEYKSCHFIIATHSPLVVAEANEFNAEVVLMTSKGSSEPIPESSVSGSIEEIMLEKFKVPTANNRYLLQRLTDLTQSAAKHEISPEQFKSEIEKYSLQFSRMRADDPQRKLFKLMKAYGDKYADNK